MKLKKTLLRWYKSFHLNYLGNFEKGEATAYRPWNKLTPPHAVGEDFPFIEIPIETDITTIVGANESGKSHLLNAISKLVRGKGIYEEDEFKRTDLCHYASIRTRNVEAWPNIGLQFSLEKDEEFRRLNEAIGANLTASQAKPPTFAIVLAPENDDKVVARLFFEPNDQSVGMPGRS